METSLPRSFAPSRSSDVLSLRAVLSVAIAMELDGVETEFLDRLIPGDALPLAVDQLGRILQPALAMGGRASA